MLSVISVLWVAEIWHSLGVPGPSLDLSSVKDPLSWGKLEGQRTPDLLWPQHKQKDVHIYTHTHNNHNVQINKSRLTVLLLKSQILQQVISLTGESPATFPEVPMYNREETTMKEN